MMQDEFLLEDQGVLDTSQQEAAFTFESEIAQEEKARIRNEVKKLSVLNPVRSIGAIGINWIIILTAIITAYKLTNPFYSILVIIIIGSRQHSLLLLMHDGAHYRLAHNKKTNNLISDLFCAFPIFVTTASYRATHLAHHRYLNTDDDPDLQVKKGISDWEFPRTKKQIWSLFLRQLFGFNILYICTRLYQFGIKSKSGSKNADVSLSSKLIRPVYYILMITTFSYFHIWTVFLLYWLLPIFTITSFLLRLRSIAEHFGLPWQNELNSSRNVKTNLFERFFLVQVSANYHLDHHLYPSVPFYNLNKLHNVLLKNPVYVNQAVNSDGYLNGEKDSVLKSIIQ